MMVTRKKPETVKRKRTLPAKMTGKPAPAARLPTNHPYRTTAKWEGNAMGRWGPVKWQEREGSCHGGVCKSGWGGK